MGMSQALRGSQNISGPPGDFLHKKAACARLNANVGFHTERICKKRFQITCETAPKRKYCATLQTWHTRTDDTACGGNSGLHLLQVLRPSDLESLKKNHFYFFKLNILKKPWKEMTYPLLKKLFETSL